MTALAFITWNISPDFLKLGTITIRWYGLLYAIAFYLGYKTLKFIYKTEKISLKELDKFSWRLVIGILIGARIGYILINWPDDLLNNPLSVFIFWEGGLSAFGAAIGIMITVFLQTRKKRTRSFLWMMDRLVIPIAIGGAIVRLGNLMNSEIYGRPTSMPWGFKFVRNIANIGHAVSDVIPRHPTQLYQSILFFAIFIFLFNLYKQKRKELKPGMLLGLFMLLAFLSRFILEYFNEAQTPFGNNLIKQLGLNLNQVLCVPYIIIGVFFIFRAIWLKRIKTILK